MTKLELAEKEKQLRRLRSRVFDGTPAQQDAITAEIEQIKAQCMPAWNDRECAIESPYARVMWM